MAAKVKKIYFTAKKIGWKDYGMKDAVNIL